MGLQQSLCGSDRAYGLRRGRQSQSLDPRTVLKKHTVRQNGQSAVDGGAADESEMDVSSQTEIDDQASLILVVVEGTLERRTPRLDL